MSPLLEKIIAECPEHLRNLLDESASDIDADFATVIECAGDDDLKPKLVLSFAITINPDEHGVNNKLSWSVKKKAESCFSIDDPSQSKLDLDVDGDRMPSGAARNFVDHVEKNIGKGGGVTISADGMKPVTINGKK
jgi:hypothetical protein